MGNAARTLGGRSEAANIATMKRLIDKYEEIKERSKDDTSIIFRGSACSDLELYRELQQELAAVLGNLAPGSSPALAQASANPVQPAPLPPPVAAAAPASAANAGSNASGALGSLGNFTLGGDSINPNSEEARAVGGLAAGISGTSFEGRRPIGPENLQQQVGAGAGALAASPGLSPSLPGGGGVGLVGGGGGRPTSILVVDDSPISCKLARRALAQLNFYAEVALDGKLGLETLYARPSGFDLVLLDIVMPGLDGIEVLRNMKQHPQLCSVPVAMLSGLQDERLEKVCMEQGAVVVLRKPMKIDDVLRVVQQYCRHPPPGTVTPGTVPGIGSPAMRALSPPPLGPNVLPPSPMVTVAGAPVSSGSAPVPTPGAATAPVPVSLKPAYREDGTSPRRRGRVTPGQDAPNFELRDVNMRPFQLHEALPRHPDRKLLVAFFPAAFAEAVIPGDGRGMSPQTMSKSLLEGGPGGGGGGVLSALMDNLAAIRATGTEIVGIGRDLPFTLAALSAERGIEFPLLSDPFLSVGEEFVGTFDLGLCFPSAFGQREPAATGQRGSHAGIVVLNSRGKCLYRWVSVDGHGDPVLPPTVDVPELMAALRAPPRDDTSDPRITPRRGESGPYEGERAAAVSELHMLGGDGAVTDEARNLAAGGSGRKVSILVVDDSTISCKLAMRKLRALGHSTLHAENGQMALDIIRKRPNRINLVLLDIVMPIMDGVELLNAIKSDRELQHIPVVMLSSLEREQLGSVCLESGALAVLQKPLKANEVQDLIIREGML